MELATLSEFVNLTGISYRDLCGLLEDGYLKTASGPKGQLLIDIDALPEHLLVYRAPDRTFGLDSESATRFNEQMAAELLHQLDDIIAEAVDLAANWLDKDNKKPDCSE